MSEKPRPVEVRLRELADPNAARRELREITKRGPRVLPISALAPGGRA
jgi:hypothetical protein